MSRHRPLSREEEIANSITHGVGLLASLIAFPVLVASALTRGDALLVLGCTIFAVTLVALYGASTVYHALRPSRAKQILRVVDHVAIYLLIAGTYTPFALGVLRGAWGWTLFAIVWGLAGLGIVFKTVAGFRFPRLSTVLYLGMGWLAVVALKPLASALPGAGLIWLLAGGLLYTGGVIFYARDYKRYHHTVWHLFVLGGSGCHFLAIWLYAT